MKTLARTGAVLCFGFFSVPGLALMAHSRENSEWGEDIFGCLFIGVACFAGTLLWLMGERIGSKSDAK
jgi:drug/metabolite transporter (DMT)-like permease